MITPNEVRVAAWTLRDNANAATAPEAMYPWGDRSLPRRKPEHHSEDVRGLLGGTWGEYYASVPPSVGFALSSLLERYANALMGTNPGDVPFESEIEAIARAVLGTRE